MAASVWTAHSSMASLPFASLSSSPPRPDQHESSASSSTSTWTHSLPPLSARAQERLHQRRTALFKQPAPRTAPTRPGSSARSRTVAAGAASSSSPSTHSSNYLPSSSPSYPSSLLHARAVSSSWRTEAHDVGQGGMDGEDEQGSTTPTPMPAPTSPTAQQHLRAQLKLQSDQLRRSLRAERVHRARGEEERWKGVGLVRRGAGVGGARGMGAGLGMRMVLDGTNVEGKTGEDEEDEEEAAWEREDDELIRRTMLLEQRRYMLAAPRGTSSRSLFGPSSSSTNARTQGSAGQEEWGALDPDEAVALEEEIRRERASASVSASALQPHELDQGLDMDEHVDADAILDDELELGLGDDLDEREWAALLEQVERQEREQERRHAFNPSQHVGTEPRPDTANEDVEMDM